MESAEEDELGSVEGDFGSEEGEMDFPDEWMVLDDVDEEFIAEEKNSKSHLTPGDTHTDTAGSGVQECEEMPAQISSKPSVQKVKQTVPPLQSQSSPSTKKAENVSKKPATTASSKPPASSTQSGGNRMSQGTGKPSQSTPRGMNAKEAGGRTSTKPSQSTGQATKKVQAKSPGQARPDANTSQTKSVGAAGTQKTVPAAQSKASTQIKQTEQLKMSAQTPVTLLKSTGSSTTQLKNRSPAPLVTDKTSAGQSVSAAPAQSLQAAKHNTQSADTTAVGNKQPDGTKEANGQEKTKPVSHLSSAVTSSKLPSTNKADAEGKGKTAGSEAKPSGQPQTAATVAPPAAKRNVNTKGTSEEKQLGDQSVGETDSKMLSMSEQQKDKKLCKDVVVKVQKLSERAGKPIKMTAEAKKDGSESVATESSKKTEKAENTKKADGSEPVATESSKKTEKSENTAVVVPGSRSGDKLVRTENRPSNSPAEKLSFDRPTSKSNMRSESRSTSKSESTSGGVPSGKASTSVGKSSSDKPISKPNSRPDERSSSKSGKTRSSPDDHPGSRNNKFSIRSRDSTGSRSGERRRSWSRSRERSRERGSRYGRSDEQSSSKIGDRKSSEARKSGLSGQAGSKNSSASSSKPDTVSKRAEGVPEKKETKERTLPSKKETGGKLNVSKKEAEEKVQPPRKEGGETVQPSKKEAGDQVHPSEEKSEEIKTHGELEADGQSIVQYEKLLCSKENAIEKGLWRFSVRFSPFELADLAKPELRNLLNTAQDCVIYLKNQGQNKKKKGESNMYFNRLASTRSTTQKLFQLQLSSKKLEMEINRKVADTNGKDTATVEMDMTAPGTLSLATATTVLMSKGPAEDKNVYISNVPKNTPQELLFVVFPTASSIQMPKVGKDKGTAVIQFRSAQCAEDIVKCYTSVSINRTKLKIGKKKAAEPKEMAGRTSGTVKTSSGTPKKRKDTTASGDSKEPSQVYQIPVLNKRKIATPRVPEQVDAKRPRLDMPMPNIPPPPMPHGYGGFTVPTSIPPPALPPGMMQAVIQGDFSVPPPGHQGVPGQPPWPPTSAVPGNQVQMAGHQAAPTWPPPQQQRFRTDRDLKDTEAISPEWEDDIPRQLSRNNSQGRPMNLRNSPHRRSLSPQGQYSGNYSPRRLTRGHSSGSPERMRHRSFSPAQRRSGQRQSRSPVRVAGSRRHSRSPYRTTKQAYSPVSLGRLSRSPRQMSPGRHGRHDRSDYSPVSQGRLSHSPGRRDISPRRKGRSPVRQDRRQRRRSQSPVRQRQKSYSPARQGRSSRSPNKRGRVSVRQGERDQYSKRKSLSPQRQKVSPKHGLSSNVAQDACSPVREGQKLGRGQSQNTAKPSHFQERTSGFEPRPGDFSQSSNMKSYGSGKQSESPFQSIGHGQNLTRKTSSPERQVIIVPRPSSGSNKSPQHSHSPLRLTDRAKSRSNERSVEPPAANREGWIAVTSKTSSSTLSASRAALFPAAFSSTKTTSELFPSASSVKIPGLDLLLAATEDKLETKCRSTDQRTKQRRAPEDSIKEGVTRHEGLETVNMRDAYLPKERSPARADDRDVPQRRDVVGGMQESTAGWWRQGSPKPGTKEHLTLFDNPLSRDRSPSTAAHESRDTAVHITGHDLLNLRQEGARHFRSLEMKMTSSMTQDRDFGRFPATGRSLDNQTSASSEYRRPMTAREISASDQELVHRLISEGRSLEDNQPLKPLKSALRKPTIAAEWSIKNQDYDRPRLDHSRMDEHAADASIGNRPGFDCPAFDRLDLDRPHLDRPSFDRPSHDRLALDRAGLDRSGVDRSGVDHSRQDQFDVDRAGVDRTGIDHPQWQNQSGGARGTWDAPNVQDWNHGRKAFTDSHGTEMVGPHGQNRPKGATYGMSGGGRDLGPGHSMAGWGPDSRPGPGPGPGPDRGGQGGEGNWQPHTGGGMHSGMGSGPFGGSGSWLPPPQTGEQPAPHHHPFMPRPPF